VIEDIEVVGDRIYLAGRFTSVGGQPRTNAAAVTLTGELLPWAPRPDGPVWDIVVAGDTVLLAGNFFNADGQARTGLAAANNTDGHILPWDPHIEFYGTCLTVAGKQLYVGGAYVTIFDEVRFGLSSFSLSTTPPPFENPLLTFDPSRIVQIQFQSTADLLITPQYSVDFTNWFDLSPLTTSSGNSAFQDPESPLRPRTFYRLKQ
jgi:hypothetical protein